MKTLLIGFLCLFISSASIAQKVTVNQSDQKINKITRTGAVVYLELDKKLVKALWKKKFREFGKVTTSGGDYYIEAGSVPGISGTSRNISRVESSGKGVMVWWAVDLGDTWVQQGGKGWSTVQKILTDFARSAYKEDIMTQIAAAEKALDKTVKDQEKTIKEGEHLQSSLEKNADEKTRLEDAIKNNAEDKVNLENEVVQNKKDQEQMVKEVDKMKKAVEVVKAKLNGI